MYVMWKYFCTMQALPRIEIFLYYAGSTENWNIWHKYLDK